jgi:CubicO group peptidase (beta-lactamase class C family)
MTLRHEAGGSDRACHRGAPAQDGPSAWRHPSADRDRMIPAVEPPEAATSKASEIARPLPGIDDATLLRAIDDIVHRRAAVGLAVVVVRAGADVVVTGHGLADIPADRPVTADTVFRIGSVTKLVTAVAVMQLAEEGRVDLDAPANEHLRAYRLVPRRPAWRQASLRHLLTHTAGIPDVRGVADLLAGDLTPSGGRPAQLSVKAGTPMPSLAEYYRKGLGVVVEPGTTFAYSNHGFTTLGQIVEDVSGMLLERYFRTRIFEPLGMADSSLVRSARVASRLATGYVMGRTGPKAVTDRDWIGAGGGGVYSTPRDMARFAAALLGGGANDHGAILRPTTLEVMFEHHYLPDPRLPGMGLGFFRRDVAGRRVVGHEGILPGFDSGILLAPDDGVGVIAFTNGSPGAFAWIPVEVEGLLRQLLGIADRSERSRGSHHPEIWPDLCGRYVFPPRISDLRARLMLGGGAEVHVSGGRLKVRLRTSIPGLHRDLELEPADDRDPDVFRIDPSEFGLPVIRVAFDRSAGGRATAAHTDLGGMPVSLVRRPDTRTPPTWLGPALGAVVAGGSVAAVRRRRRRRPSG